jgi:hypothetical protein
MNSTRWHKEFIVYPQHFHNQWLDRDGWQAIKVQFRSYELNQGTFSFLIVINVFKNWSDVARVTWVGR